MTSIGALTKDLIADTSLWRLIIRIGDDNRLRALLIGPESVERSVIFHSEKLADSSAKALENAIYDNPLLLGDFSSTDVIFSTSDFFASPRSASALREQMASTLLPDLTDLRRTEAEPINGTNIEIVYCVNAEVYNFAARTFAAARFHHSMAINAGLLFHRNAAAGASAHAYALCEPSGELVLVAFTPGGTPSTIMRRNASGAADCAYHILAAGAAETTSGPLSVGGEPDTRNEVCALLRQMRPDSTILPLTLSEDLLNLRRLAPEAAFDMIFMTQL